MKAVDTNIVLRFLLNDDPVQTPAAEAVMREGVLIPATVLLETGWVLASRYGFDRHRLADALGALLDLPTIHVPSEEAHRLAIEHFRGGTDFADALHLVAAGGSEAFVTFDRALADLSDSPLPIELAR